MIRIRVEQTLDADIAIVGAGPAGAAAACHLARRGYSVLLFDQSQFPRDKVCGDFVGPAALIELEHLDLLSLPVFQEANQIRQAALYLDGTRLIGRPVPDFPSLPDHGLCIPRAVLDNVILDAAIASGARLQDKTRVTGYKVESGCVVVSIRHGSEDQHLRVRLLVGADGSSSLISRILRGGSPPKRDRIVAVRAYYENVDGPQEQADLYFSSSTFPGYCWLFPTGGTSANVGVGTLLETWPPTKQQLSQVLTDVINSDAAIRFRLSTARMVGKIVGWPLATFNPNLAMAGDRVVLIGDAAGLINPLNGEGIQYALQSARWLAETMNESLQRDYLTVTDLAPYVARVHHELRYDMALARLIIDVISNRTLNPLWLQVLRTIAQRATLDGEYARRAGAILAGMVPAREALSFRILWGTMQHLAINVGSTVVVDALHGPRHLWKRGVDVARTTASMAVDTVLRPTSTLNWGVNCALSTIELASQVTAAVLEPNAKPQLQVSRDAE